MKRQIISVVSVLSIALILVSCVSSTDPNKKAKQGAAVGAVSGAVVGAVVGHQSGNRTTGAVVGAAVGAGVGAAVGHQMDKQQAELEQVEGVEVTRTADDQIDLTLKNDVLFDIDSATLQVASRATLDEMAGVFVKYPETRIHVAGHADSTGSEAHNQQLSTRRAETVKGYLTSQGVDGLRIDTIGYGETLPKATNDTPEGRQLNRRVEIRIKAQPGEAPATP